MRGLAARAGIEDVVAEAFLGRDELADHDADHRHGGRDLGAAEEIRQRVGDLYVPEGLPAACGERAAQPQRVGVGAREAGHGGERHRKEADEGRVGEARGRRDPEPEGEERRQRDLRDELKQHHVRIDCLEGEHRGAQHDGDREPEQGREQKSDEGFTARGPGMVREHAGDAVERGDDVGRGRQDHLRDVRGAHRDLPDREKHDPDRERQAEGR